MQNTGRMEVDEAFALEHLEEARALAEDLARESLFDNLATKSTPAARGALHFLAEHYSAILAGHRAALARAMLEIARGSAEMADALDGMPVATGSRLRDGAGRVFVAIGALVKELQGGDLRAAGLAIEPAKED